MCDAGSAGAVPQISGLGSAVMIQTLDSPPMQAAALFCRTLRSLRFRIWERYEPLLMIQSSEVGLPHALPADDQLDLEMTPEGGLGYLGLGRVLASSVLMQSFVQTLGAQKLSDQDFAILLRDVVSGLVG
jgi:hypothetical protein